MAKRKTYILRHRVALYAPAGDVADNDWDPPGVEWQAVDNGRIDRAHIRSLTIVERNEASQIVTGVNTEIVVRWSEFWASVERAGRPIALETNGRWYFARHTENLNAMNRYAMLWCVTGKPPSELVVTT